MPKLIHAMIRVLDLPRAADFYQRAFGMQEAHRLDFPTFTLVYLREAESGFEIELTLNKGQTEPYAQGAAYGHLAFCVEDLSAEHARLKGLGFAVGDIKALPAPAEAQFFFVTDPDGYKIEVLKRAGHYV